MYVSKWILSSNPIAKVMLLLTYQLLTQRGPWLILIVSMMTSMEYECDDVAQAWIECIKMVPPGLKCVTLIHMKRNNLART